MSWENEDNSILWAIYSYAVLFPQLSKKILIMDHAYKVYFLKNLKFKVFTYIFKIPEL